MADRVIPPFPWVYPYQEDGPRLNSVVLRPVVPISVAGVEAGTPVLALVDSGCVHVLAAPWVAAAVGLDPGEGLLAGGFAKIGELTAAQLSAVLTEGSISVMGQDPKLATEMAGLAKLLYGTSGKISAGLLATATSQLIAAQQIDAEGIVSDQLQDLLTQAAQGGD